MLYEICSFHAAAPESETYRLRFDQYSDYEKWIRDMAERSEIDTGADLIAGDHVITLSMCTDSSSGRIVMQGKQIWRKEKDAN